MATFAKSTFNTSIYSASRPTYPPKLFEFIFNYHRRSKDARWDRAIDLGCGTGQATVNLTPFSEVVGLDPSKSMIGKAKAHINNSVSPSDARRFRFGIGSAENLRGVIGDGTVDLSIAAQAAHWFDWSKVWPEMLRVLRKGGSAAFWVYSEFRLAAHPSLTPLITSFLQGTDPRTSLGPHFQRPGRTILERHLIDVPDPVDVLGKKSLGDFERVYFTGLHHPNLPLSQTLAIIMSNQMRWRDLLGYLRTASALHNYHEIYPEDLSRKNDERFPEDITALANNLEYKFGRREMQESNIDIRGGDIATRFWKDLREGAQKEGAKVAVDDTVAVEWPIALILTRKL